MPRQVIEWTGRTDDSPIPTRVRLRVWDRCHSRCMLCGRKLGPADKWQCDHEVALVNGGKNIESNLRVVCDFCHKTKTAMDVAEKAAVYAKRTKHLGLRKSKKPMMGSKASGWKRTFNNGWVRR